MILKSILEDVSFRNLDIELEPMREDLGLLINSNFRCKARPEEAVVQALPTSPPSVTVAGSQSSS